MQPSLTLANVLHVLIMAAPGSQARNVCVCVRVVPTVRTVKNGPRIINRMQWMGTGAAGLPGAHAMLLIGGQGAGSVITLSHSEEGSAVRASIGKKKTVHSQ